MKSLFIIIVLFLSGCNSSYTPPSSIPTVLVTLAPYSFFVDQIAQNTVNIITLIPPEFNPHLFEPTPQKIDEAFKAALWLRSEEPYEKKILSTFASRKTPIKIINLLEGIPLRDFDEKEYNVCNSHSHARASSDLHVWLNPKIAEIQAKIIFEALTLLQPEHKEFYQKNYDALIENLENLDKEISSLLSPLTKRTILVSHPSLGYYCDEYHLHQLSIECEGKDPRPQQVEKIFDLAKESDIQSVLIQAQYNNKGAILIAEKLHLTVHLIDPYSKDYINNLKLITEAIVSP